LRRRAFFSPEIASRAYPEDLVPVIFNEVAPVMFITGALLALPKKMMHYFPFPDCQPERLASP
jgi:hypothetical protein